MKFITLFLLVVFNTAIFPQSGWQQQASGTTSTLLGVIMTDQNTAYACGINGMLLKSTNGGTNWFALATGTNRFL
ncbi:MAG: hypothetical protein JNK43_01240, partial [Ignavibacteria bacterium]|nr:hypothetical protein [Ignavibacteria bacterium]